MLDGTFTDKNIQIGTASNQVLRLAVASTDSTKLGAYQLDTIDETIGRADSFSAANTAVNALFSADADYTIKGTFGTYTAMVDAGAPTLRALPWRDLQRQEWWRGLPAVRLHVGRLA